MDAILKYVAMRQAQPLKGLGDSVHQIHTGTKFEAELRFSDLEAVAATISGLTAERDRLLDEKDVVKLDLDALIAERDGLRKALDLIAGHKGKTIYSHDPEYRQGAHDAYEQLADMALAALAPHHASDCATNNAPALPNGPCDCGATAALPDAERASD